MAFIGSQTLKFTDFGNENYKISEQYTQPIYAQVTWANIFFYKKLAVFFSWDSTVDIVTNIWDG
jgi:hypothetical protein